MDHYAAQIDLLHAQIAALRQEASYATSGGEGMAAMGHVRNAQAALAAAYVAAADGTSDTVAQRSLLEAARATMVEILTSAHGPDHEGLLPSLGAVLSRLGIEPQADHRAIAAAWQAEAERAANTGRPRDAGRLERRIRELMRDVPGAALSMNSRGVVPTK